MKFSLKLPLCLLLGLSACCAGWAATPSFWAVDPLRNQTELINPDLKTSSLLKFSSKPYQLKALGSSGKHLLLCQGNAKMFGGVATPGSLTYLDRDLQPTGAPIILPGIVNRELYLETANLWLIITTGDKDPILNVIDPINATHRQFKLKALPNSYLVNADQSQLLLALNPSGQPNASEVLALDLKNLQTRSYPVAMNAGAIYYSKPNQLFIASGGFRESQKYPAAWKAQVADKNVSACLQFLDTDSGKLESIPAGYSPLVAVQDQTQSDTFYSTSLMQANFAEPRSTLRIIQNGKVTSQIEIPDEIIRIVQAPSGNLCLLGRARFFLIDPKAGQILTTITTELRIDSIQTSPNGKLGYLFIAGSSKIPVIDLQTGQQQTTITINRNNFLDSFKSLNLGGSFFAPGVPPVQGTNPWWENKSENSPANQRILFRQSDNRLIVLTGRTEISMIDLKTNQVERKIKLSGVAQGFHQIPGSGRLMAVTDQTWELIDPEQAKPLLKVTLNRDEKSPQKGYYNADGTRLVVPFLNQLHLLDTQNAKYLGKIRSKAENPFIIFP